MERKQIHILGKTCLVTRKIVLANSMYMKNGYNSTYSYEVQTGLHIKRK